MKLILSLFSLVIILSFSCCNYDKTISVVPITQAMIDSCTANVTYSQNIHQIITTNCALSYGGCHVNSASWGDFTTYSGVLGKVSRMKQRVNDHTMPPSYSPGSKSLSTCDILKINKWIDEGALDN